MNELPYGLDYKDGPVWRHEAVSWQERTERTNNDYGPPASLQWPSQASFEAWWAKEFGEAYTPEKGLSAETGL